MEVQAALAEAEIGGQGAAPLAPVIEELLRGGAPGELAGLALDALGAVGSETSSPAIAPMRATEIRKREKEH